MNNIIEKLRLRRKASAAKKKTVEHENDAIGWIIYCIDSHLVERFEDEENVDREDVRKSLEELVFHSKLNIPVIAHVDVDSFGFVHGLRAKGVFGKDIPGISTPVKVVLVKAGNNFTIYYQ